MSDRLTPGPLPPRRTLIETGYPRLVFLTSMKTWWSRKVTMTFQDVLRKEKEPMLLTNVNAPRRDSPVHGLTGRSRLRGTIRFNPSVVLVLFFYNRIR